MRYTAIIICLAFLIGCGSPIPQNDNQKERLEVTYKRRLEAGASLYVVRDTSPSLGKHGREYLIVITGTGVAITKL